MAHACMDELIDIGLYPHHSALSTDAGPISSNAADLPNSVHTSSCATPTGSVPTSSLTLADPLVHDVPSTTLLFLRRLRGFIRSCYFTLWFSTL